jgi:hypothetical protein
MPRLIARVQFFALALLAVFCASAPAQEDAAAAKPAHGSFRVGVRMEIVRDAAHSTPEGSLSTTFEVMENPPVVVDPPHRDEWAPALGGSPPRRTFSGAYYTFGPPAGPSVVAATAAEGEDPLPEPLTGILALGQPIPTLRLYWPEGRNYLLRRQEDQSYQRVELEKKEGFAATLYPLLGRTIVVSGHLLLQRYTGAPYDPMLKAFLEQPQLLAAECKFAAPVIPMQRTVVCWHPPTGTGQVQPNDSYLRISLWLEPPSEEGGTQSDTPTIRRQRARIDVACFEVPVESRVWRAVVVSPDRANVLNGFLASEAIVPNWETTLRGAAAGEEYVLRVIGGWDGYVAVVGLPQCDEVAINYRRNGRGDCWLNVRRQFEGAKDAPDTVGQSVEVGHPVWIDDGPFTRLTATGEAIAYHILTRVRIASVDSVDPDDSGAWDSPPQGGLKRPHRDDTDRPGSPDGEEK